MLSQLHQWSHHTRQQHLNIWEEVSLERNITCLWFVYMTAFSNYNVVVNTINGHTILLKVIQHKMWLSPKESWKRVVTFSTAQSWYNQKGFLSYCLVPTYWLSVVGLHSGTGQILSVKSSAAFRWLWDLMYWAKTSSCSWARILYSTG